MSGSWRRDCALTSLHVRSSCAPMQHHDVTVTVCRFVRNIGAICTYAFAGTFVSTVAIAFIM